MNSRVKEAIGSQIAGRRAMIIACPGPLYRVPGLDSYRAGNKVRPALSDTNVRRRGATERGNHKGRDGE
jgi:hypothetical protein